MKKYLRFPSVCVVSVLGFSMIVGMTGRGMAAANCCTVKCECLVAAISTNDLPTIPEVQEAFDDTMYDVYNEGESYMNFLTRVGQCWTDAEALYTQASSDVERELMSAQDFANLCYSIWDLYLNMFEDLGFLYTACLNASQYEEAMGVLFFMSNFYDEADFYFGEYQVYNASNQPLV